MVMHVLVGANVPAVRLGRLRNGQVERVQLDKLVADGRSILIGVPGAFTPVCSKEHVPDFIAQADRLRAGGFRNFLCIVANDPFVVAAWADQIDPEGKVTFLSDGNLDLADQLGVRMRDASLFLGSRSQRYMMVVRDGVIDHFAVEKTILAVTCTRPREDYLQI